jgi:hypothetical protein
MTEPLSKYTQEQTALSINFMLPAGCHSSTAPVPALAGMPEFSIQ